MCHLSPLIIAALFAADPIVKGDTAAQLDTYLGALEDNGFSGAILVAKDGDVILQKGYGMADREDGRPVTVDTVFDIGSITKQFTAAAIMKLWDEGKLHPSDTIDKYFDDVPDDKRIMTIHHLLTHTSGLRESFGDDYMVMERDTIVERILKGGLKLSVGDRYLYSNAGYSLLGALVEKLSGMGYEEYLRKSFFDPLGMSQTGYISPKWDTEKLAVGYHGAERWATPIEPLWADDGPYWNLRCNGGILSTVGDMYKWHQALLTDQVLSDQARERMFTPFADEGGGESYYGYGWVSVESNTFGGRLITHNGGNGYFFADCYRYVDAGLFLMIMTNAADQFDDRVSPLLRILAGRDAPLPDLNPPAWKKN